jgi:hypothetical protein
LKDALSGTQFRDDDEVRSAVHEWLRRVRLKRNGTRAETRFRLSEKRTSPFESAGVSA